MTLEEFQRHVAAHAAPPADMAVPLKALWHATKGHWDTAHELAQRMESLTGSWIHAHLHREEGDVENASYWYGRAGKPMPKLTIGEERETLIHHFLHGQAD